MRFAPHAHHSKAEHPDGPGARAFYALFLDLEGNRQVRAHMLAKCRAMWPTNVTVDGVMRLDMHLGWSSLELDEETGQHWACATVQLCHYMLSGVIPPHLRRNCSLGGTMVCGVTSGVAKRPAAVTNSTAMKKPARSG